MTAANIHRSAERSASVLLRFSKEDRELLKQRAHDLGMSVQDYADLKLLGKEIPARRPSGRPRRTPVQDQELPLTG